MPSHLTVFFPHKFFFLYIAIAQFSQHNSILFSVTIAPFSSHYPIFQVFFTSFHFHSILLVFYNIFLRIFSTIIALSFSSVHLSLFLNAFHQLAPLSTILSSLSPLCIHYTTSFLAFPLYRQLYLRSIICVPITSHLPIHFLPSSTHISSTLPSWHHLSRSHSPPLSTAPQPPRDALQSAVSYPRGR